MASDEKPGARAAATPTRDIPQADDLARVRTVLEAVAARGEGAEPGALDARALGEATGIQARHVSYALGAARVLGWLDESQTSVTPAGWNLLATEPASAAERELMRQAVSACAPLRELGVDVLAEEEPTLRGLAEIIASKSGLAPSTAERRAVTLLAWRRQLRDGGEGASPAAPAPAAPSAATASDVVGGGARGRAQLFRGGPVLGMGGAVDDAAEALAVRDGKVLAIGTEAEVRRAAGADAVVHELEGRAVLPAFIDAHHHLAAAVLYAGAVACEPERLASWAAATGGSPGAPLAGLARLDTLLERLRDEARHWPEGQWIVGTGFDPLRFQERRAPTREELDRACPRHPVLLVHYSFHEGWASSAALVHAAIGRSTADPPGGEIVRGKGGEPTGHLVETALGLVERFARRALGERDRPGFAERFAAYERRLFAAGIGRIVDPTVSVDLEELYAWLRAEGRLRMPVVMMPHGDQLLSAPWDRLDGPPTGSGPEALRVGPMKLFFDGGDRCAICATVPQLLGTIIGVVELALRHRTLAPLRVAQAHPMRLGRDLRFHSGKLFYPEPELARRVVEAPLAHGFGVAIHALGNEAVAQAADVLAEVLPRYAPPTPPRIEHATMLDEIALGKLARSGATAVVQPGFLGLFRREAAAPLAGVQVLPLRSMREARIPLAGSSDAPVTAPEVLPAVARAVRRLDGDGEVQDAGEALGVLEALALYTRDAARASGCLDVTGTLEPGKRADLVVLSADPRRVGADALERLAVVRTVAGGETVYEGGDGAR